MVSLSQVVSLAASPRERSLLQHGVLPKEKGLPMGCSSSGTTPTSVPPMGCSSLRTGCSSVGTPWGHKSYQETCFSMGSSLHESAVPWQEPFPALAYHGTTAFFWASACSSVGLLSMVCRGISSGAWRTFFLSFLTVLGVYKVVPLTYSQSSRGAELLWHNNFWVFFFLTCIITEALPPSLMGSALVNGGSILEKSGIGSVGHGGNFWELFTIAPPKLPNLAIQTIQTQYMFPVMWVLLTVWSLVPYSWHV